MSKVKPEHIAQVNAVFERGTDPEYPHLVAHCTEAFQAVESAVSRVRRLFPELALDVDVSPYVVRARKFLNQRKTAEAANHVVKPHSLGVDKEATQAA